MDFSDLHPTFVELAKAKPAADRKLDGKSFAPQVLGQLGQPRDWAYVQLGDDRFVRSDRWKLTGSGDLFDMKEAPYRQISVAADTTATDALAARSKLQTALDQLKAENANQDALVKKRSGKKKDKKNKDPAPATP